MWEFTTGDWSSGPVAVAVGAVERARGLVPAARHGLVLRARSVHGFGMVEPLLVVGLAGRRVTSAAMLPPAGIVTDRSATVLLELPPWRDRPPPGAELTIRRIR